MNLNKILDFLTDDEENSSKNLIKFLRIPSISTDKNFKKDCKKAANWVSDYISSMGFKSNVIKTKGHPIVLATSGEGNPHLLFYGHYDVQPVDPLEEWDHDPFDPFIKKIDTEFV